MVVGLFRGTILSVPTPPCHADFSSLQSWKLSRFELLVSLVFFFVLIALVVKMKLALLELFKARERSENILYTYLRAKFVRDIKNKIAQERFRFSARNIFTSMKNTNSRGLSLRLNQHLLPKA